jgi:Polyketide cyclase / dehydrase and lipid transport
MIVMWTHQESMETHASPARLWQLFADVPGWKAWNAGIEHIELHGPFAEGTTFTMQPPGTDAFVSTLLVVVENQGFTDETVIDGTCVTVAHHIEPLASGRTRVTYSTRITGPAAAEIGPLVTGDFGDVLAALKRTAESA